MIPLFDTGGQFAAGVVIPVANLLPVVHLDLRISPRISEKIEMVLIGYSGAGGNNRTTLAKLVAKFAAGVVDTSGQFATNGAP